VAYSPSRVKLVKSKRIIWPKHTGNSHWQPAIHMRSVENSFGGSRNFSKQTVNTAQRLKFMYLRVRLDNIVKSVSKLLRKNKTEELCIRFVLFSRWPLRNSTIYIKISSRKSLPQNLSGQELIISSVVIIRIATFNIK